MGGIALHAVVPHAPLLWICWLGLLIGAAVLNRGSARVASAAVALGLLAAGIALAQLHAFQYPRHHISAFAGERPRLAQLELQIDHPPRVLTNRFEPHRPLPPKQVTTATVTRVRTWDGWEPASGKVLVQIAQPHARLAVGQTIRVLGMLQRPAPSMNPGQFDWAGYYREQRILASLQITTAGNIAILSAPPPNPVQALREQVRRLLAAGFPAHRSLDHALLQALLLGDNDPELRDVQEQFRRTGTSHHLAISGLHVAVLGGLVWGLCRLLRLPPRASVVLMTLFVILYGVVALPSPPVVRSVLLCAIIGLGLVTRRRIDAIQLLSLSVLAMLVYHPLDLYNAGFQLSFGTVLGLMLFTNSMRTALRGQDDDDKVVAAFEKVGPVTYVIRWLDRLLITALAAGIVAWVVSMPLVMYHFGQVNPWAVIASIVLAPVVFLALIGGLMKVLLTLLWPSLDLMWAAMATQPVRWMRGTVDWLGTFPWGDVPVPAPAIWFAALFYLLLLSGLFQCRRQSIRVCLRGSRILAVPLLVFLPFRSNVATQSPSAGEVRVTLLAVGAGQCAVIEPPSGRTILIDAGSISLTDLLGKCLGPFLRQAGYTHVDTVFITHANIDHFNGVEDLVAGYGVREVLTGMPFAVHCIGNPPAEQLLETLHRAQRPPRKLSPGERLPLGSDTEIEVLWPPKDSPLPPNDTSLVVRLTHAGRSLLFTGDIQEAAMRELLKDPQALRSDVLIAPHHGSSEDSTAAFVRAVEPQYILSSNDRTLSGKQRRFDELTKGMTVYRTHNRGAITVTIDAEGALRVEPFLDANGQKAR